MTGHESERLCQICGGIQQMINMGLPSHRVYDLIDWLMGEINNMYKLTPKEMSSPDTAGTIKEK